MNGQVLLARSVLFVLSGEIYNLNVILAVEKKFPGDRERLARMSLIEGEFTTTTYLACD